MGLIGILIGLALLIWLALRGWSVLLLAPAAALLAAGLSVRRINPNKLRQFARARGVLAKNDRLDARLIAEYGAISQ